MGERNKLVRAHDLTGIETDYQQIYGTTYWPSSTTYTSLLINFQAPVMVI